MNVVKFLILNYPDGGGFHTIKVAHKIKPFLRGTLYKKEIQFLKLTNI